MPGIKNLGNDPIEKMLRLFKKQVEKAGVIGDWKRRTEYEKPSLRKKKKRIAAQKRRLKQESREARRPNTV